MSNAMCIQLTYINMHTNIYFPREQETMLQLVPSFISQADHTVSCEYRAKLQRRCGKELWKEERWKCGANVNAQWARALTHTLGFHSKSVLTQGGPSLMGEHRFSCGWSQKCPPPKWVTTNPHVDGQRTVYLPMITNLYNSHMLILSCSTQELSLGLWHGFCQ